MEIGLAEMHLLRKHGAACRPMLFCYCPQPTIRCCLPPEGGQGQGQPVWRQMYAAVSVATTFARDWLSNARSAIGEAWLPTHESSYRHYHLSPGGRKASDCLCSRSITRSGLTKPSGVHFHGHRLRARG